MKAARAPVKARAPVTGAKARLRAHAALLYRRRRESPRADCRVAKKPWAPVRLLLRRVGEEAARLSALSRRGVITQREVAAALQQLTRRRNAVPTDGA